MAIPQWLVLGPFLGGTPVTGPRFLCWRYPSDWSQVPSCKRYPSDWSRVPCQWVPQCLVPCPFPGYSNDWIPQPLPGRYPSNWCRSLPAVGTQVTVPDPFPGIPQWLISGPFLRGVLQWLVQVPFHRRYPSDWSQVPSQVVPYWLVPGLFLEVSQNRGSSGRTQLYPSQDWGTLSQPGLGIPSARTGVPSLGQDSDTPPLWTGYSTGGTPLAVSRRRTYLFHFSFLPFVYHILLSEALDTRDPPIICKTLKVMMTLANLDVDDGTGRMIKAGAALVPYYRQLLPVLNMFKMKNGKFLKTKSFFLLPCQQITFMMRIVTEKIQKPTALSKILTNRVSKTSPNHIIKFNGRDSK